MYYTQTTLNLYYTMVVNLNFCIKERIWINVFMAFTEFQVIKSTFIKELQH